MKRNLSRSQTTKEKNKGYREAMDCSIRAIGGEGNERTFELSFSSEEPYTRWFGPEILDHAEGCVDLERLNSIGCLLFNHNRDKVVGKIQKAWIEDNRGKAEVVFDNDEASDVIYQKVKSGTLKGVSVGYMVDSWEEILAKNRLTGVLLGHAVLHENGHRQRSASCQCLRMLRSELEDRQKKLQKKEACWNYTKDSFR